MSPLIPLFLLLTAGVGLCQQGKEGERVLCVTLQRNTVSAVTCPLKTPEEITWTVLEGGQKGASWRNHLIFTNVKGPRDQLYKCQHDSESALLNVTVTEAPSNTIEGTIDYCQHGKPCALRCPFAEEAGMDWSGIKFEKEMWWGEEWDEVHTGGDNPIMIKPGVILADYLRNPSLLGCKRRYYITEAGHNLTGLPVGHSMNGLTKKVKLKINRPDSRIVKPVRTNLSVNTISVPVSVGQRAEIECEGITWDYFDEVYWLKRPCRHDSECQTTEFIPNEGRLSEQKVNTSLTENALARTVSMKLVFDPVEESDLKNTFYCKLDSAGARDILTVYLRGR